MFFLVVSLYCLFSIFLSLIFYYIKHIYYILWNQTTIRIGSLNKHSNSFYLLNIFLMCPIRLPLFFVIFVYVIASIAYIHPVYGRIRTHEPSSLSTRPGFSPNSFYLFIILSIYLLFSLSTSIFLLLFLFFSLYFFVLSLFLFSLSLFIFFSW
jgi:hypothetical protein